MKTKPTINITVPVRIDLINKLGLDAFIENPEVLALLGSKLNSALLTIGFREEVRELKTKLAPKTVKAFITAKAFITDTFKTYDLDYYEYGHNELTDGTRCIKFRLCLTYYGPHGSSNIKESDPNPFKALEKKAFAVLADLRNRKDVLDIRECGLLNMNGNVDLFLIIGN